ncbi:prefoldin subunit alpha [Candidatus Methanoprimaticola sp. MG2]|uniref:prefoldin subunit alpha n=1 Tax=Candidatus Methanoprimaticola sp. MG2 TaxID=3228838 RepID=UPI0039C64140
MDDNELRQALALMDAYKERVEAMSRQVQVLRVSLDEVNLALESVKAFKDAKEGDEIMVPVGASCYIPVKVTGNRTVVTGIGSGISIQKTSEESIDYLDANSAEISEALKKSVDALNEAQQNLTAMSEAVQQEYAVRRQNAGIQQ